MTSSIGALSAVVGTRYFPLPESTGGRKRAARLLDAMVRSGFTPRIISGEPPGAEALATASERGWIVSGIRYPAPNLRDRLARHRRGDLTPTPHELGVDLATAAAKARFVQLEEIGSMQYARYLPMGVPIVASLHNVDSVARANPERPAWYRSRGAALDHLALTRMARVERRIARRAVATLCCSEHDAEHFRHYARGDVILAPNGVDDALFEQPFSPDAATALFFGALNYQPNSAGLARFLRASWPQVTARVPGATLEIAGMGAPEELRRLAQETAGARFHGFVDDLGALISQSRLVIAPIWFGGGTRIKVLEALAAGRPVAGTAVGVEQIGFEHGRHGLIATDDQGLAAAVVDLLQDSERARRLGAAGRALASRYRWRETTAPAEALYARLTAADA